jgi:hypothetical protein
MIKSMLKLMSIVCLTAALSPAARAVAVSATSDIFAAGLSGVPTAADGTVPVFITVSGGQTVTLTATGTVQCCDTSPGFPGPVDANGFSTNPFTNTTSPASTISANAGLGSSVGTYSGNAFALVGAFNNQLAAGPFFIGTNSTFVVPTGATELFLGFADASGFNGASGFYDDNSGALEVAVAAVPEASTWAMMVFGFFGLGFLAYRNKATLRFA